jgi:hypothetical protein
VIGEYQTALVLLDALWTPTPGWSTLSYRPGPDDRLVHTAVRTDDRDGWARWLEEHHDVDCYFRVCPMAEVPDLPYHRGDASLSIAVPCLWADVDFRSAKHRGAPEAGYVVARLPLLSEHVQPSTVIHTGNGFQLYVPLDEPVDPALGAHLLARWVKQLRLLRLNDDRKGDLASLMRLPATFNSSAGVTTELRAASGGARVMYSAADLDDDLPALEPGEEPRVPDGVTVATVAQVEEFLDRHQKCDFPRALTTAVEGIDGTVARNGGDRHPSLRLYLWQSLAEAIVGAYPARRAVDEGYAHWRETHILPGERRARYELRELLRWSCRRSRPARTWTRCAPGLTRSSGRSRSTPATSRATGRSLATRPRGSAASRCASCWPRTAGSAGTWSAC